MKGVTHVEENLSICGGEIGLRNGNEVIFIEYLAPISIEFTNDILKIFFSLPTEKRNYPGTEIKTSTKVNCLICLKFEHKKLLKKSAIVYLKIFLKAYKNDISPNSPNVNSIA